MGAQRFQCAVLIDYPFTSLYNQEIRDGIEHYCRQFDIDVVYFGIGEFNPHIQNQFLRSAFLDFLVPELFDGVIISTGTLLSETSQNILQRELSKHPLPLVSIAHSVMGEPTVSIDNRIGFRDLLNHLLSAHKYTRLAFVSGPLDQIDAQVRYDEYHQALQKHGIPGNEQWEYFGLFSISDGEPAVHQLLEVRKLKPQVIICANDQMAIGVWQALNKRGIAVPEHIAVTGYDDIRFSPTLALQLSTVLQPVATQSWQAVQKLHLLMQGKQTESQTVINSRLVVRHSCGCWEPEIRNYPHAEPFHETFFQPVSEPLSSLILQFEQGKDVNSLVRDWAPFSRSLLQQGVSIEEIDHFLFANCDKDQPLSSFIQACRLHTMRESMQSDLANRAMSLESVDRLRDNIDALSLQMTQGNDFSTLTPQLDQLAQTLKTRNLLIMEFEDHRYHDRGSIIRYAMVDGKRINFDDRKAHLKGLELIPPFFPIARKSLVALMITNQLDKFGYVLLDTMLATDDVYEYLRSRLSSSIESLVMLETTKKLNSELMKQIVVRKDAERQLQMALEKVESMSASDEMTGLMNRRGFLTLGEQQLKYLRRQTSNHFLIFVDLDNLKIINDTWGHRAGDAAIIAAARVLRSAIREVDLLARLGGDEFVALISQTEPPAFEIIKQRINKLCAKENLKLAKPWQLAMTLGYYAPTRDSTESLDSIIEKADQNLYSEKARKKAQDSQAQ